MGAHTSTHGRTSQGRAFGREKDLAEQGEEEEKAGNTFCSMGHGSGPTSADCKAAAEKEYINIYIYHNRFIYGANRLPAY